MADEAKPSLARTVEDATREAMAALMGTAEEAETPAPEASASAAEAPEAAQPGVEPTTTEAVAPAEPEAPVVQATEEDTPNEWFGVDLTGLPADKRAEIISGFKERDKVINRLFQAKAAEEGTPAPTPAPEVETPPAQPEPVTDEQILAQLGIKEDDPLFDMKSEIALPLARAIVQQQEVVNSMAQAQETQAALDQWNTEMVSLETQFGKLPAEVTQEDVLDFALKNNLSSPAETYFKMVGPLRQEVTNLAREARKAIRDKQGTGPRPRSTTETAPKAFEGTVAEVFKDAAAAAASDLGTDWKSALKGSGWSGSELED